MNRCSIKSLLLFLIILLSASLVDARDLGFQGETFSIKEENLKEVIQSKAESSRFDAAQKRLVAEKIQNEGELFKKVSWLEKALKYTCFFYSPSKTLYEDILDAEGKVLHKKGTEVNPLDHITLDSGLLFFDGSDPRQVEWAESQEGEFKWILIAGSPLKLQEEKERPIFFDQGGVYSKKFGLKRFPCRITQSGTSLLIEEIPVKGAG